MIAEGVIGWVFSDALLDGNFFGCDIVSYPNIDCAGLEVLNRICRVALVPGDPERTLALPSAKLDERLGKL